MVNYNPLKDCVLHPTSAPLGTDRNALVFRREYDHSTTSTPLGYGALNDSSVGNRYKIHGELWRVTEFKDGCAMEMEPTWR